jgi:anti-sigma B factor antagonist
LASLENFPVYRVGSRRVAVVTLPDEIDILNAEQIRDTLLAVLNRDVTTLVADMTGTTFCACAGASALVRAQQRAAANRAGLRVAVAAPLVRRVLALTGVDRLVPVYDSVADALTDAAQAPGGPEDSSAVPVAAR